MEGATAGKRGSVQLGTAAWTQLGNEVGMDTASETSGGQFAVRQYSKEVTQEEGRNCRTGR